MGIQKYNLIVAFFGAMTAVMFGAFGAHVLREQWELTENSLRIFQTGVQYQFYHSLALAFLGLASSILPRWAVRWSAILFSLGILLFSGSLYLLSTRFALGIEQFTPILGPMTPIGGMCFIIAWAILLIAVIRK